MRFAFAKNFDGSRNLFLVLTLKVLCTIKLRLRCGRVLVSLRQHRVRHRTELSSNAQLQLIVRCDGSRWSAFALRQCQNKPQELEMFVFPNRSQSQIGLQVGLDAFERDGAVCYLDRRVPAAVVPHGAQSSPSTSCAARTQRVFSAFTYRRTLVSSLV